MNKNSEEEKTNKFLQSEPIESHLKLTHNTTTPDKCITENLETQQNIRKRSKSLIFQEKYKIPMPESFFSKIDEFHLKFLQCFNKNDNFFKKQNNLIKELFMRIEKKTVISRNSLADLIRYFKAIIDQNNEICQFTVNKIPKLGFLFRNLNETQNLCYPFMSKTLMEIDEFHSKKYKQLIEFNRIIESVILKEILENRELDFEKRLKNQIENFAGFKVKSKEKKTEIKAKFLEYNKTFSNLSKTRFFSEKNDKKEDILQENLCFMHAVSEEITLNKLIGKELMDFWEETVKFEYQRLEAVNKSLSLYFQKCCDENTEIKFLQDLLLAFNPLEEIQKNFEIKNMLFESEIEEIKDFLKKPIEYELNSNDLKQFFIEFSLENEEFLLENYEKNPFILKHFLVFRDVGNFLKSKFLESLLIITVDGNIMMFDKSKDKGKFEEKISEIKFRIDDCKIFTLKDQLSLEIICNASGWIFPNKVKILLKFANIEKLKEFEEFFRNLEKF